MGFPDGEDFRAARVVRAWEPPEEVVIPRVLAYADGLQPEDYGVLVRLLLRDPNQPSSVVALSKEFQASGWKMGEKRLREVMKRLKAAGHVEHGRWYNPEIQRPEWQFRVYRNPANNQAYVQQGADAFSQVSPIGRKPADRLAGPVSDPAETGVFAGQPDRAETGGSEADPAETGGSETGVFAGQPDRAETGGSAPSPPTPPQEEVDTSSPSSPPHVPAARTPQKEGEGESHAAQARVAAAAEFLAALPEPWACGLKTTRELAPLLAEVTAVQGWDFAPALAAKLTENPPERIHSLKALLKGRIEDLPRRSADQAAGPASERCPYHPGREAATCPACHADSVAAPTTEQRDPEALEAAKAAARQAARRQLDALLAPPAKRPRPARSRRARQAQERRQAEEFEQRRAQALRALEALEERAPEAGEP